MTSTVANHETPSPPPDEVIGEAARIASGLLAHDAAESSSYQPDDRDERRAEVLSETMGMSPAWVRAATGVGEVAAHAQAKRPDAGLQHPEWTEAGRREHLAGAERTRVFLERNLGLPRTRAAKERADT